MVGEMEEFEIALKWEEDVRDCRQLLNEVFLQIQQHYRGVGIPDTMIEVEDNLSWIIGECEEAEARLRKFAITAKGDMELGKLFTIDTSKNYPDDSPSGPDDSEGYDRYPD